MAVVVLELVNARAAGVAFSADPLTGKRDRIVIESNWGFGESVVQGVVTPDRAIVDKADLRVLDETVSEKVIVSVYDPSQRLVVEIPTPELFRNQAVLSTEEIQSIAQAVRSVEENAEGPVDVEWVLPGHRKRATRRCWFKCARSQRSPKKSQRPRLRGTLLLMLANTHLDRTDDRATGL